MYSRTSFDPTDKYSKSIRETNKHAINFFGFVICWFIFFSNRGLSDLKGITQVQTQRRGLISVSNFTRRLAENPHRTTEAYLFFSFPALFPSILFLKCCCFFFFQIVRCCSVNCVVSSWSSWGSCNARCESNGQQRRSRRVTTAASCRGTPCPTLTQTKSCRGPCCRRDCQVQLVRR